MTFNFGIGFKGNGINPPKTSEQCGSDHNNAANDNKKGGKKDLLLISQQSLKTNIWKSDVFSLHVGVARGDVPLQADT